MCGIAGIIDLSPSKRIIPTNPLVKMARALAHRGPDGEGALARPGLHFVHTRLSIVGLADGQQPLCNEDETVWTSFNGEFFDYPEVKKSLEAKGHVFRTHTDTELIVHLWEEYREKMLYHLKGQFSFVLWDSKTNEFLLARDRSGILPLFYTVQKVDGEDYLLFASEMKALFATGMVPAKANFQGLNHIFTFFGMPGPLTVFEGIQLLQPGHYLHFKPGTASSDRLLTQKMYWQISYPDQGDEDYGHDEDRVIKGFEEVLYAAVERRLRADVPVVSYLSGGVDSSLIVAMASKALGRPIPTFTVAVQQQGLNEESEAMGTARALGCQPVVVPCSHEELRRDYPTLIGATEFPVIDTAALGLMHLAKAVRNNGYKVVMTGEGADEWLAGYPWFKMNRIFGWMERIPGVPLGYYAKKAAMTLLGHPMYPREMIRRVQKLVGGHNGWMDVYGMMALNKMRFFTGALRDHCLPRSPYEDIGIPKELYRWHPFHRQMYYGARVMLAGHLLASKGDRVAMHSSVEARYPFLDEAVIAYMAKLHPRWKLRGLLRDKFVERKVAEKWLPKEVAHRRKFMFLAPMDSWIHDMQGVKSEPWIGQVLSEESVKKTGYFDHTAIVNAQQKLARTKPGAMGRTGLAMGLTAVVSTQLWHHLYISGDLCELPKRI